MTLEERVRRFHIRATAAFVILALGGIAGLGLERHDAERAAQIGTAATHRAVAIQHAQAHGICVAVNEVRSEAQRFVLKLASDTPATRDASPALRAQLAAGNRLRARIRAQATQSFKITHCP